MIIGHEFTHGFDDLGSEYDEFGNEENWWEPDTKANFQKQKVDIDIARKKLTELWRELI